MLKPPAADTVGRATSEPAAPPGALDASSRQWLDALAGTGRDRDRAVSRLHELLLRAARHEVSRRRHTLPHLRGGDHDDLAQQAAGDALVVVLAKLGDFRGDSRFTTWAYKFALYEAAAKTRRRAWRDRELPLDADFPGRAMQDDLETAELLRTIARGIEQHLTAHQREVLVALAVNGVPIDVLAERLDTTRGALYKTLHD
ncbi:MAG: sigma-70 family RNA polymerase sigma factor, partial [Solirubrobacteraceae bacterium]